ncbi:hypothetical protein V8E53_006962 [Lactarius tabidus]
MTVDQTFKEVGNDLLAPGPTDMDEDIFEVYSSFWRRAAGFCPLLWRQMDRGDVNMKKVGAGLAKGARNGRSHDISKLKSNTGKYLSEHGAEVTISLSKSGRGFNDNLLGRMLIPIQHIAAYDKDPVGIRAKVNAGDDDYRVTAEGVPSFLYEDPLKYDPENVFSGLMRGRFLIRCLRSILLGPSKGINGLGPNQKANRTSIAKLLGVVKVTVPLIVYTAVMARFTITNESQWSGKDGLFDYQDFAELLFTIFEQDSDWTEETLKWWTKEIFGHKSGRRIGGVTRVKAYTSDGFLARAKAQARARRAKEKIAPEDNFGKSTTDDRAGSPLSSLGPQSRTGTPTPQPPSRTPTPQPPSRTPTPQPPSRTPTPQPPSRTPTPQPPSRTPTPQPPPGTPLPVRRLPPCRAPRVTPATPPNPGLNQGDNEEMAGTALDDSTAPALRRKGPKRGRQNEEAAPATSPPAKRAKPKAR